LTAYEWWAAMGVAYVLVGVAIVLGADLEGHRLPAKHAAATLVLWPLALVVAILRQILLPPGPPRPGW